nr:diphosphate--fructose-6-phosphate 1-phosphotransferase [Desulfitobacterium hafniense]
QIPRLLADLHVDYLLLIGGNGTMFASKIIAEKAQETGLETQVIGVPKTVDNDIMSIDHTPGYASAAKYIAQATLDIGLDLWSMRTFEQVRILEIMGRNVGWLAAAAGLAKADNNGAPHLIYLPEVAFDEDEFINDLDLIVKQQGYALVVVGEGIRDKNNNCIGNTLFSEVNSGSHTYGGAANYLTTKVSQVLNLRARVQDLGMAQRCFYPARSEIDEQEAYLIGRAGVKAAVTRLGGSMVNILDITPPESVKFSAIPLVRIGGKEKQVPEKFYDKQTKQVTKEFVTWLRPLLGQWNSNYLRLDEINLV